MHRHNDYQWAAMQFHVGYQCSPVERYVPTSPAAAIDSEKLKKNTPRATSRATARVARTILASSSQPSDRILYGRPSRLPWMSFIDTMILHFRDGDSFFGGVQ